MQRGKRDITTDIDIICSRIEYLRKKVENREEEKCLICLLNPEWLLEDIELFGTGEKEMRPKTSRNDVINFDKSKFNEDIGIADEVMMAMDLSAVLELIDGCKKEENAQKLMDQYNRLANAGSEYNGRSAQEVRDVKKDLEQLWTVASRWGIHFMVCLDDPDEFSALRLKSDYFKHKLLFQMTGDEAFEITGSSKAGRIEPGMFCYRGKKELYYRPYEWQEG